mgnify:CR=1 FL=1
MDGFYTYADHFKGLFQHMSLTVKSDHHLPLVKQVMKGIEKEILKI